MYPSEDEEPEDSNEKPQKWWDRQAKKAKQKARKAQRRAARRKARKEARIAKRKAQKAAEKEGTRRLAELEDLSVEFEDEISTPFFSSSEAHYSARG